MIFPAVLLALLVFSLRATAQSYYSPGVYIIGPSGEIITGSYAQCPAYADYSCSGIGYPDWCCPASHTCHWVSGNEVCGCCPEGADCTGNVNVEEVTTATVTVTAVAQATTQWAEATTTTEGYYNGYCSTLYEKGPGLPTTRQGSCGTVLVVNGGSEISKSWTVGVVAVVANAWILGFRRWL